MLRSLFSGLAAAFLVLACASSASADSIAYIKDGNVWLTTPDGARQYQVTSTGGYSDVTQADDGAIVALNGVRLHKLSREGAVLADFATPVSDTRPAGSKQFWGPYDPAISPDGTKVAYTYYWLSQTTTPNCYPPKCLVALNEGGTGYTWSDRMTDWKTGDAIGYHSGWRHPSWVDNDMTLLANPTKLPNHDLLLDRISDGGNGKGNMVMAWFSDIVNNPHMSGAEITRDKRKLAAQTGENDSTLTVYMVRGFPSAWKDGNPIGSDVVRCYRYEGPEGGAYGQPTWSPDGSRMAFNDGAGLKIANVPNFANECTTDGATPQPAVLVAGATEPDWGPADVPAPRPVTPTQPAPPAQPAQPTQPTEPAKVSLPAKVAGTPTRKSGVTLEVKVTGKGKLSAVATLRGKIVGKASQTVKKAGTAKLKLKVSKKGKLSVKVTFKPVSGAPVTKTMKVNVR
ncbi:PD40 domain-containing protein [Solirubrobacter sp. CPCC 204708]|uniref:PD40 domain-containing protein n=1 Tax=Solirubrobacter deserti TaxID=2282478 RepID=A0ABT4RFX7_9ACTN|nr:PD40 domain-containing protein [Solirubrobacter deserti]MBE2318164.1 PD40 domain-containing protein [Solirubrobacter deserti]MDA0137445.1 PD40 domain-containing protein [Solirubrobacter deserti]